MNKTTENFIKALMNYKPIESIQPVYKLIYDIDSGKLISITIDEVDHDNWIEITKDKNNEQIHLNPLYSVVNKKLVKKQNTHQHYERPNQKILYESDKGNIATDSYNMLLINSAGSKRWNYD